MITNSSLTIYHRELDKTTRFEKWIRTNYENVWIFAGKGARVNKGYDDVNNIDVRIPYNSNQIDLNKIQIGDILVNKSINNDISTQQDLKGLEVYNITSINNNNFGNNPHVHIGGK